jgi:hypothetical protein
MIKSFLVSSGANLINLAFSSARFFRAEPFIGAQFAIEIFSLSLSRSFRGFFLVE